MIKRYFLLHEIVELPTGVTIFLFYGTTMMSVAIVALRCLTKAAGSQSWALVELMKSSRMQTTTLSDTFLSTSDSYHEERMKGEQYECQDGEITVIQLTAGSVGRCTMYR